MKLKYVIALLTPIYAINSIFTMMGRKIKELNRNYEGLLFGRMRNVEPGRRSGARWPLGDGNEEDDDNKK